VSTASAQGGHVGIYSDAGGTDLEASITALQPFNLYVVWQNAPSALGVQFKVNLPQSFTDNAIFAGFTSPFPSLGNPTTGVQVAFESCLTPPVLVMTLGFIATGDVDCSVVQVVADPAAGTGHVVVVDCGLNELAGSGGSVWAWTGTAAVVDRTPVDGATGVPTNVDLDWNESFCFEGYGDCFSYDCEGVFLGTDPDPPYVGDGWFGYDPGDLQPHTTYYWKVSPWYVPGPTPVWSFTTGAGPVAAERSTWGGIKALYR
jgi:hypothetical protein